MQPRRPELTATPGLTFTYITIINIIVKIAKIVKIVKSAKIININIILLASS